MSSWNILKKAVRRFKPDFDYRTQEASQILDRLIVEFDGIENAVRSLNQTAKKIPDILLAQNKFDLKLVEDLSNARLFDSDEQMKNVIEEWHKIASDANSIGDDYIITLQKTFNNSIKQLRQSFAEMKSAIRLREAIYSDVIKYSRKVVLYEEREKTGTNMVKLAEAKQDLIASQEEFSKRTFALTSELSKFLHSGIDMFHPSLEAFIASEMVWIRTCQRSINNQPTINEAIRYEREVGSRKRIIDESFERLNSLSIMNNEQQQR